jgi:hypothetical protein
VEKGESITRLLTWTAFLLVAIMIEIIASSILNYSPSIPRVTLFDEVGAALPFALIAALATYFLLKSHRPDQSVIRKTTQFTLRVHVFAAIICIGMFLGVLLFILLFIPMPPGIPVPSSTTVTSQNWTNALSLPSFDLLSLLVISVIAFPIMVLLLATFHRKKVEVIEDTSEEGAAKETWSIGNRIIDDEYRRAILVNYMQGKELMVNQGVPSSDVITAREFESNVLDTVSTAGKDFTPLTRLFEEARFSLHLMGESQSAMSEKHYKRLQKLDTRLGAD